MMRNKAFSGDLFSSTVPRDLSKYARVGVIQDIDPEEGTCTVRWYDKPSAQRDVYLTQSSPNSVEVPEKGAVVIAVMDQFNRAFIVGYFNVGHAARVKKLKTYPKFKDGEKFFEVNGAYFHIKKNGNIVISTLLGGIVEFNNVSQTWKYEVVNWKLATDAGVASFGVAKRKLLNTDGTTTIAPVLDSAGKPYNEYTLTLYEMADGSITINPTDTPILTLSLGTVIDQNGNVINSNNVVSTDATKQLAVRLSLKSGIVIDVDKAGVCKVSGIKLVLNGASVDADNPDISSGLQSNDSTLGNRGQHIAREHDEITIPLGLTYSEEDHNGLTAKNTDNLSALADLAKAIISPSGPCFLNPSLLPANLSLKGEITEGSTNLYAGDN